MGFPDEGNTGVPPGVTLTPSGSITINTAGAVVSGVLITAPNVTPENCRVAATSWGGIVVQAPGAVIENRIWHSASDVTIHHNSVSEFPNINNWGRNG